jgi:hypothetical protein
MEAEFYVPDIYKIGVELYAAPPLPPRATMDRKHRVHRLPGGTDTVADIAVTTLLYPFHVVDSPTTRVVIAELPSRGEAAITQGIPLQDQLLINEPVARTKSRRVIAFRRLATARKASPTVTDLDVFVE